MASYLKPSGGTGTLQSLTNLPRALPERGIPDGEAWGEEISPMAFQPENKLRKCAICDVEQTYFKMLDSVRDTTKYPEDALEETQVLAGLRRL